MTFVQLGQSYNRWTVLERVSGTRRYLCRCECGTTGSVFGPSLINGTSKSCGCYNREVAAARGHAKLRFPIKSGDVFARLTVVDAAERLAIVCRCECGTERSYVASNLLAGITKSCGCLKRESARTRTFKHGVGNSDYKYRLWSTIKGKCFRTTHKDYQYYGGRGITMHARWIKDYAQFATDLLSAIGERPSPQHSLDRIDNEGNYEPGNLRWATMAQQSANRRISRKVA